MVVVVAGASFIRLSLQQAAVPVKPVWAGLLNTLLKP